MVISRNDQSVQDVHTALEDNRSYKRAVALNNPDQMASLLHTNGYMAFMVHANNQLDYAISQAKAALL